METEKPEDCGMMLCNSIKIEVFEEDQDVNSLIQNCSSFFTDAEVTTNPETGQPYCVLCFEELEPETIMYHMINVHKFRKVFFKCWNCEQIFQDKNELTFHKQTCEPPVKVKQKPTISNFIREANEKYNANVCPICLIELSEELAMHLENEHKVHDPGSSEPKMPTPSATCHLCKEVFKSRNTLGRHLKQVHDETVRKSVPCPECDKKFASYKLLSNHLRNVHPQDGKVHTCHECGKRYKNHQSLHQHLKNIHKKRSTISEMSEASEPSDSLVEHFTQMIPDPSVSEPSERVDSFTQTLPNTPKYEPEVIVSEASEMYSSGTQEMSYP